MPDDPTRSARRVRSRAIPTLWRAALVVVVCAVMAVVLTPLVFVLASVLGNLEGAVETLSRTEVWRLVGRTVLLALCVTVSALALATGLAWVIVRRPAPGGRATGPESTSAPPTEDARRISDRAGARTRPP